MRGGPSPTTHLRGLGQQPGWKMQPVVNIASQLTYCKRLFLQATLRASRPSDDLQARSHGPTPRISTPAASGRHVMLRPTLAEIFR